MSMTYTKNAIDAINATQKCARELGHDYIGSEHILLCILEIEDCSACKRFVANGLSLSELSESLRSMLSVNSSTMIQRGALPLTARTHKVLDIASQLAGEGKAITTVHLVSAIMREGENAAAQLLFNVGLTLEKFLNVAPAKEKSILEHRSSEVPMKRAKEQKTTALNAFGRDLTLLSSENKLDPVIGRKKELKRVIQVLARRTKNNAVLIGEAGVGKTAIAEALAQAIARGDVPERLQNRRVIALDMARVVAGTQYRGQFEERLQRIIDETKRAGNIILFLDEIHTMVGAGGAEGAMDAANILKPALSRGELQCVGATTLNEYRKSIEKDAALERRFQSVLIDEPTIADTIEILQGLAKNYEEHHGVNFSQEALRAAVELTSRYLPARQLPDKAIDAIDETGARLRMAASARPKRLQVEQEKLAKMRAQKEEAIKEGDFDLAAECREKIRVLAEEFEKSLNEWRATHNEEKILVSEDDIAETVSTMSGVPVEKMNATTAEKLIAIEKTLGEVVVGQSAALKAVARALRRSRAFLADPKRPIGSFLFLGPTGVGKTHLAKMLAEQIYGDEKALITIDMSEYQEKASSSRLVGAPPGYVGYDEGGQLTERVRRRPYSVVLFDEFEKANSDVCNMLLQILDDGRLTDGQGRVIDFRNTIIICTANLGFDFARAGMSLGFARETSETSYDVLKGKLLEEAKRTFRPELLNRFDETVVFGKLERSHMGEILQLELNKLQKRLTHLGATIELEKSARDFLVEKGYDSALGARPMRRIVQEFVEDPLADILLCKNVSGKIKGKLSKDGKSLVFSTSSKKKA